jgi:2-polyprenyl-3-methyl-5-hydroxy-6-metoxy-1,4-benzoquinol methylase
MHFTEYWAILERNHTIQNPTSPEKMGLLADYCRIKEGLHILDVGSGKGWLLRTWAKAWAIEGTGLEINPWYVAEARQHAAAEGVADRVQFIEGPALDFVPQPESYDVVLCIGASFALNTFAEALSWMRRAVKPSGVIAIGEPFLTLPLPPEVAALAGPMANMWPSLAATVAELEAHNLELSGLITASPDDWDRCESPHWPAAREWAAANPDHPDREEFLQQVHRDREAYLGWQRDYLGWSIFVAVPT